MPVVAALGGHAFGGGLELALACDLRVCRRRARSSGCRRRGSASSTRTPGLRRFVDAIGAARTRELFLTARPVDAAEALAWGLVNEVVEDVAARAVALAAEIAALAPLSLRGNKRVLQALIPPLDPALEAELDALRDSRLPLRGLRRGRPRLHREASTEVEGNMSADDRLRELGIEAAGRRRRPRATSSPRASRAGLFYVVRARPARIRTGPGDRQGRGPLTPEQAVDAARLTAHQPAGGDAGAGSARWTAWRRS